MLVYSSQQIISWRLQAVCYRIDLNDAIRLIIYVLYTLLVKFSLLATTQK